MGPEAHREGEREWLFVRFYDFNHDGTLTFNMLTLRRDVEEQPWRQQEEATFLRPWRHGELVAEVESAGFAEVASFGDMTGAPFAVETSGNLILTAFRVSDCIPGGKR